MSPLLDKTNLLKINPRDKFPGSDPPASHSSPNIKQNSYGGPQGHHSLCWLMCHCSSLTALQLHLLLAGAWRALALTTLWLAWDTLAQQVCVIFLAPFHLCSPCSNDSFQVRFPGLFCLKLHTLFIPCLTALLVYLWKNFLLWSHHGILAHCFFGFFFLIFILKCVFTGRSPAPIIHTQCLFNWSSIIYLLS